MYVQVAPYALPQTSSITVIKHNIARMVEYIDATLYVL